MLKKSASTEEPRESWKEKARKEARAKLIGLLNTAYDRLLIALTLKAPHDVKH